MRMTARRLGRQMRATRRLPLPVKTTGCKKWLTLVTHLSSAIPEDAVLGFDKLIRAAAPTVQDGSVRESHPETPNGSPPKPSLRTTARTKRPDRIGAVLRQAQDSTGSGLHFPSRCCAASAGLNWPEIAPQSVHTCFTRFLTGTRKATRTPLPTGANPWRGIRSEQPSKRRASTKAAAW